MIYGSTAVPEHVWAFVEIGTPPTGDDPLRRPTEGPCWEWTGSKNWKGYGKLWAYSARLGRKALRQAHVCFWEWEHGESLPAGAQTDHLCRNPGCVNPGHLERVTPGDNVRRGAGPHQTSARNQALVRAGKCPLLRPDVRAKALEALLAAMPEEHRKNYEKRLAWRALPLADRQRIGRQKCAALMRSESQREKRRGDRNAACKLSEADVREIRAALSRGEAGRSVAGRFGISESMVRAIKSGRKWGWLA